MLKRTFIYQLEKTGGGDAASPLERKSILTYKIYSLALVLVHHMKFSHGDILSPFHPS